MSEKSATSISNRLVPAFRYARTPSLVMPEPIIPDGVLPPQPGIHELFELRMATDDAAEATAFAIRWQVYCNELGYEPAERFPDQQEHDAADQRSVSVVAYYRPTGTPVGCYRLVLADPECPTTRFHLEEVCGNLLPGTIPQDGIQRRGFAELSRFCITAPFRRFKRAGANQPPAGIDEQRWQAEAEHRLNLAALMWLSAAHLTVHLQLDYLLSLMEPRLQKLARSWGFVFTPIGAGVEFRGTRLPYRIDRRALRALLRLPCTANLLAPVIERWNSQAIAHPLLANYLRESA